MGSAGRSVGNAATSSGGSGAESSSSSSMDNVWSTILTEVRSNASNKKLPSGKRVVVVGPPTSGKTTLLAKLQGLETPIRGSGLEYTYLEIRDEYRDDSTHLSVFTLDGDKAHSNLLHYALNESNIKDTIILLTVSIQSPWLILEQLTEWAGLIHDHIDGLKIDPDGVRELRDIVKRQWRQNDEEEDGEEEEPKDILSRNMGVEVIVVVTKTDLMGGLLEKEYELTEEHFDFIQMHVRRFCLNYGASLFYCSVKEDKNCDLLYKFLVGRVYSGGGNNSSGGQQEAALVVERDAVFIPSGWDNPKKIQILHENMPNITNPEEAFFNDVIVRPPVLKKNTVQPTSNTVDVDVEDEQRFLERQLQILHNVLGSGVSKKVDNKRVSSGGSSTPAAAAAAAAAAEAVVMRSAGTPQPGSNQPTPGSAGTPKKGEPQHTDRVLANFFNSLLTSKKSGGSGGNSANNSLNGTDC